MCAFAIAKIRGGGEVNLKVVGLSSLDRHVSSSLQVVEKETDGIRPLAPLRHYSPLNIDVKKMVCHPAMKALLPTLTRYFVRAGKEGFAKLNNLLQYRLTGGCAGKTAHELVDAFMAV